VTREGGGTVCAAAAARILQSLCAQIAGAATLRVRK
jgi:hypothetical protein